MRVRDYISFLFLNSAFLCQHLSLLKLRTIESATKGDGINKMRKKVLSFSQMSEKVLLHCQSAVYCDNFKYNIIYIRFLYIPIPPYSSSKLSRKFQSYLSCSRRPGLLCNPYFAETLRENRSQVLRKTRIQSLRDQRKGMT